jgi:hypothetical protein
MYTGRSWHHAAETVFHDNDECPVAPPFDHEDCMPGGEELEKCPECDQLDRMQGADTSATDP